MLGPARLLALVAAFSSSSSSAAAAAPPMILGVDVSTPVNAAAALCMKQQHNIDFAISRAWYSDGAGLDHAAIESGASFRAANISFDVYMFPCSFGLSAASQVEQLVANLSANQVQFGSIWFDVEYNPDSRCAWSKTNKTANCEFMTDLVKAAESTNALWGVYSSIHMWTEIMTDASNPGGCASASAAGLPLWYPHYESPPNPTFSDFAPFGGWSKPTIKQFGDGDVPPGALCGIGVDNNVAPAIV